MASVHRQSDTGTSIVQNQNNYIAPIPNPSYPQPQTEQAAVGEEEKVEEADEPTPEEIGEVCIQLRRLSPDISINLIVRSAIRFTSQYFSVKDFGMISSDGVSMPCATFLLVAL